MWKPDICLYHFPCDDGFAAAWVVRKKWPNVTLAPTNYGQPLPENINIDGENLLICDFSYKPDVLAGLSERAKSIIILDHHKSAEADLSEVPRADYASFENVQSLLSRESGPGKNVLADFDMERSGASLAWRFCFPGETMPRLLRHIEDRDLWRMELEQTRSLSLFLRSYPYDFGIWDDLARAIDDIGGDRKHVMAEARAIERFYDRKIDDMAETATLRRIGQWHDVPVAHAPYAFASDLAHELLQRYPDAPFAAVIVDAHGGRTYSLRSEDSRQDVSVVAQQFGGGGHRNAAGFRVP